MGTSVPRPRPLSVSSLDGPPSSLIYAMLPLSFQNRIPRLSSIRDSVNRYQHRNSRSRTPPPAYSSPEGLMSEGEAEPFSDDEYDEDRPNTADSSPPSFGVSESKTGIVWKYANQGSNLLRLSVEESSSISVLDDRNAAFGRQLYLHALTYLLRGLPTDLSVEEQSTLQRAVPLCVFKSIKSGNSDQQLAVPSAQSKDRFDQPSLIHRILASIIVQLFILFQCILPYLKLLARSVYSYDRDHQVSERLVAAGADTMDKVSKRSLELGTAVLQMGDGKVGQTLNELAIWWLEGVAGGICQGIGEGMIILGNGKQNVPPRQAR